MATGLNQGPSRLAPFSFRSISLSSDWPENSDFSMSEPTSADSLRSPPGLLEALTGTARPEQGSEWSPPASGFRLQPASGSSSQNAEVLCGSGRGCGSWSRSSGLSLEAALPGVVDVRGRRAPSDRSRRRRREELVRPAGPLRTGRARRRAAPRGSGAGTTVPWVPSGLVPVAPAKPVPLHPIPGRTEPQTPAVLEVS